MQSFLARTGLFALFFAISVPIFTTPALAQDRRTPDPPSWQYDRDRRDDDRRAFVGAWTMSRNFSNDHDGDRDDQAGLRYRLRLRRDGDAEMVVERVGDLPRPRFVADAFGSMLTVYLRDDRHVVHTGRWSADRDGDRITITLTDIDGRRDVATFRGSVEDGRLRMTTDNPGMYGRFSRFVFRREHGGAPRDRDDYRPGGYRNDADRDDYRTPDDREDRWSADSMTWQGSVDAGAILYIREDSVRVESTNDKAVYNTRSNFNRRLPQRPVRVSLERVEGRGTVTILEQPSRRNSYTATVKINDPQDGRGDYRFTLYWE